MYMTRAHGVCVDRSATDSVHQFSREGHSGDCRLPERYLAALADHGWYSRDGLMIDAVLNHLPL
eukprot:2044069-Prymnesium_polylepis.1